MSDRYQLFLGEIANLTYVGEEGRQKFKQILDLTSHNPQAADPETLAQVRAQILGIVAGKFEASDLLDEWMQKPPRTQISPEDRQARVEEILWGDDPVIQQVEALKGVGNHGA